ncbi:SusC/RagA family TonB-linked outer membrane protein [Flammeovirgaceae bacterium SG7u.111]|nr:SusC/RagA family TonB-linked outer membrane protein [Flammeovirgaceae bacterium SG7u.132]WPO34170.1 SusC/RagA family TonB-linked outer membrane protein [Flammeovirgaceae bacterium SG7u.111]
MKMKVIRQILRMSKYVLFGFYIQMLFAGLLVANNGNAQSEKLTSIELDYRGQTEVSLLNAFKIIEKETNFRFAYNNKEVKVRQSVKLLNNTNLYEVLVDISKNTGLKFKRINNSIYVSKIESVEKTTPTADVNVFEQTTVSGKVTSGEDTEPLPGVSILIKGTSIGTTTDIDGNFTLSIPTDATLVFSYIGFIPQEVVVGTQSTINIVLEPDLEQLEEVVVIGYGTQRKSDLTGALSSVSEEDLKTTIVNSFEAGLQGRAAGVQVFQNSGQPGGGVSVRVRGVGSVTSTAEPLYVIDGIPLNGEAGNIAQGFDWAGGGNGQTAVSAMSAINPADIVSIEVLKDASATAIYGSRAANGVVLITTKKGKTGEAKFEYDGYYGIQEPSKLLDVMGLQEYARYNNEMVALGFTNQRDEFLDPSLLGEGTSWQQEVFQSAAIQNHQLSVSGGSDKTTYAITGGYFDQEGTVVGSWFKRYSMRVNLDTEAKPWLKIGNTLSMSMTQERITLNDSEDGVIAATLTQAPDIPLRNADGSWGGPTLSDGGITNPVAMALDRDMQVKRFNLLANVYAQVKFTDYLNFRTELGTNIGNTNNYGFNPTYEYGNVVNDKNQSRRSFAHNYFWIWKNYLTFNKTFNSVHNITAMVGQESQEASWESLMGQRNGFVSNDIQELNAGDASSATNAGSKGSHALFSYFGRAFYSYDDRYLLTATLRYDGSSNFGPANKWGTFPSVALAWKINNEAFMSNVEFVSNLKLRLGYGEVGNQNIGGYQYGSSLKTVISGIGSGFLLNNIPNDAVRWEGLKMLNAGIDIGLLEDRIGITVDVYDKYTDGMLIRSPIPNFLGGGSWMGIEAPVVNLGELRNRGIELTLNTVPISNANFSWSSDLIVSHNQNEVVSFGDESLFYDQNVQWFHHVTRTGVGQPVGQFYGYEVEGIYQNAEDINNHAVQNDKVERINGVWVGDIKYRDISGPDGEPDGQIDATYDRTVIGNPYPDVSFGWTNKVNYKNFDLTVYLQGTYGNDIYNFTRRNTEGMTNILSNYLKTVANRAVLVSDDPNADPDDVNAWYVSNSGTDMPRAINTDPNDNRRVSSRYVEDGSYLRIKNIMLGYNLPSDLASKIKARSLRVYVNLQNIYTFTNYSGYDPEIGAYNQNPMLTGVDNGRYPMPRMYTGGVTLGF